MLTAERDPALLRSVTALKLAEEEAIALAGGLDEALARLARRARGARHVRLARLPRVRGRRLTSVPARPVATEPTGAGDAFGAAYVVAREDGLAPVEAAGRAAELVAELLGASPR